MWLGFDLGTQSVRVVAVSEAGRVLAQSSHPLTSRRDGARHQQDAEEWWRAAVSICDAALAALPTLAIRGLAIDNTSGTILLIDKSGNTLTAGLMYDYTHAADEARRANEAGADIRGTLGYRIQPSWALPKLLWLVHEHRDVIFGARLAHQVENKL